MVNQKLMREISKDFSIVMERKEILGILLFGSVANEIETNKSDIDICVVAPNEKSSELLSFIWQNINVNLKKYDVRTFTELPLYIKIQVIEDGILIYSPNKYDLYEYLYPYRKLWADQKHRNKLNKEELLSL